MSEIVCALDMRNFAGIFMCSVNTSPQARGLLHYAAIVWTVLSGLKGAIILATITAGQALVKVLERWGIDHVYGIPADSINNVVEGLWRERDSIRYVQVRHEEAAALAAAADAKLSGKIGVTFASAGPGSVHMLNGLYDAKMDNAPVLALVGQVSTRFQNTHFFQELSEVPIFSDVAVYNRQVSNAEQIPAVIEDAIKAAYTQHGVAVVILPDDLSGQHIEYEETKTPVISSPSVKYDLNQHELDRAVEAISNSKRPVLWIGRGMSGKRDSVMRFAEHFHMPVISTAPATGIVSQTWPNYMGRRGRLGDKPAFEASQMADLIVFAGTNYPFGRFLPHDKTIIQVNTNPSDIGNQLETGIAFVADGAQVLDELTKREVSSQAEHFEKAAQRNRSNWLDWLDKLADDDSTGLAAESVLRELSHNASGKAVFSIDVGNNTAWSLRQLPFDQDQHFTMSSWYGTMGYAVPAGLSAAMSYPDRDVWTISGDGGFAMVNQEILTEVRYQLPVVNIVLENKAFGFIRHEQIVGKLGLYGTDLQGADWAQMARSFGAIGLTATDNESVRSAFAKIREFKAAGDTRPIVLDAKLSYVDPIDTSFMPLNKEQFGADMATEYRKRYHLDNESTLAELLG